MLRKHPKVQAFLKTACRGIHSLEIRRQVEDELLDHIESALENGIELEAALRKLGDAKGISASLAFVHRPLYYNPAFMVLAFFFLLMAIIPLFSSFVEMQYAAVSGFVHSIVNRHQNIFIQDQKILAQVDFFRTPSRSRDAGPFLNRQVEWSIASGIEAHEKLFIFLLRAPTIQAPKEASEHLSRKKKEWLQLKNIGLDADIDFRWMQKLSRYDHWDYFSWDPMQKALADLGRVSWWTIPTPNLSSLRPLVQLRLLRGLRTGEMIPALQEVRQLARLVYTNETLLASLVSISFLDLERAAFEQAVRDKILRKQDWLPISKEITTRAHRSIFAYAELFQIGNAEGIIETVLRESGGTAGYCSALSEGIVPTLILRDQLGEKKYPLEVDFSRYFSAAKSILENPHGPCRLTYAKALYGQKGATSAWFSDARVLYMDDTVFHRLLSALRWNFLMQIPWVRQWAIMHFYSIATPDFMSGAYSSRPLPGDPLIEKNSP